MPLKFYKLLLQIGVFAAFWSFFIISSSMYFPYITGKQIYFNVLVEVIAVLWVAMMIRYPESRPRKDWVIFGFGAWLLAILISAAQGIDWNLSFWGDAERMLGIFHILHFFVLYLIIVSVFRTKKDWTWLLSVSVLSAVSLAAYAFIKAEGPKASGNVNMTSNISTLGNATYVAGVMLINFFLIAWLWRQYKDSIFRTILVLSAITIAYGFFYANVSGSFAGLASGILIFALLYGFLNKNKKIKKWSVGAAIAFVAIVAVLFMAKDTVALKESYVGRAMRDFTLANGNLNTRLYAWRAALLGLKEYPIFGDGYGNFAFYFDKYFKGGYYNFARNEEYFDKAHNNLLDLACTGGVVSLVTYLSIFVFAIYYLSRAYKRGDLELFDLSLSIAVLTAYFVHNLAVFDSLANYVNFITILGLIYWQTNKPKIAKLEETAKVIGVKVKEHKEALISKRPEKWEFDWREVSGLVLTAGFSGFLIIHYNMEFTRSFAGAIESTRSWSSGNPEVIYNSWSNTLSHNTPLDRDIRSLLASQIVSNFSGLQKLDSEYRDKIFDLAAKAQDENIKLNPRDVMMNLWGVQVYLYKGVIQNNRADIDKAMAYANTMVADGGEHIPAMILRSNVKTVLQDYDGAIADLKLAKSWNKTYYDVDCYLADALLRVKKQYNEESIGYMSNCLDHGNRANYMTMDVLNKLDGVYAKAKDYAHQAAVNEILLAQKPDDDKLRQKTIDLYKKSGNTDKVQSLEKK